jgi:hypothetical protein
MVEDLWARLPGVGLARHVQSRWPTVTQGRFPRRCIVAIVACNAMRAMQCMVTGVWWNDETMQWNGPFGPDSFPGVTVGGAK